MQVGGARCFRYFTVDSSILAAFAAAIMLWFELRGKRIPRWALLVKFIAAAAVGVTFFTVVFFLGPMMGYRAMFAGKNLFMHAITPIVSMGSFCLWEREEPLSVRQGFLGVLPTAVYGALYLTMVVVIGAANGGWPDFYGFNIGGLWSVSMLVMLAATAGLSQLLRFANRMTGKS